MRGAFDLGVFGRIPLVVMFDVGMFSNNAFPNWGTPDLNNKSIPRRNLSSSIDSETIWLKLQILIT